MSKKIQTFIKILRELQKIDQEFPLQYAVCLAEISQNEGLSLTQLSQKTGMALSTVSRIVGALSKHRQKGKPFELVRVSVSKTERRRKELYLTAKGKAFVNSIADIL
ncbi:MAG: helix-turn-helix domain-containing protein [Pseudomonadota bacterium]